MLAIVQVVGRIKRLWALFAAIALVLFFLVRSRAELAMSDSCGLCGPGSKPLAPL